MVSDVATLVVFLVWVHFLPFLAHLILHDRFGWPIDGGANWVDGGPVLGAHKTWRGILVSILGGGLVGPVFGLSYASASAAAALAMAGDLATSFVKRRLGRPSGTPMFGLDQFAEGGLPLAVLLPALQIDAWTGIFALLVFVPFGHAGSLFFRFVLHRPSVGEYPRIIRTQTRLREWRACHMPAARWHHWLNFENYFYYRVVIDWFFRAVGRYEQGVANVLAVQVHPQDLEIPDLPAAFDGFRILLLTDLHLDGLEPLTDVLIDRVRGVSVDLCLIGGDIRMELYGPIAPAVRLLRRLVGQIHATHGTYGVLGNHDCIEMLPDLEEAGVRMLVNDAEEIRRGAANLWLVGVDDPHFYKCHDLETACRQVPPEDFKILLAHSPEAYREAFDHGIRLYLCGHTHGGQICLPKFGPLFTHCSAPRRMASGRWNYRDMLGYTSRGAGASGVPLRFNCPGEIPLISLRRAASVQEFEHGKPQFHAKPAAPPGNADPTN